MIRAILFTAVGYWISRKVYENYDLQKRKNSLKKTEDRLENYLKSFGWKTAEIKKAKKEILRENE